MIRIYWSFFPRVFCLPTIGHRQIVRDFPEDGECQSSYVERTLKSIPRIIEMKSIRTKRQPKRRWYDERKKIRKMGNFLLTTMSYSLKCIMLGHLRSFLICYRMNKMSCFRSMCGLLKSSRLGISRLTKSSWFFWRNLCRVDFGLLEECAFGQEDKNTMLLQVYLFLQSFWEAKHYFAGWNKSARFFAKVFYECCFADVKGGFDSVFLEQFLEYNVFISNNGIMFQWKKVGFWSLRTSAWFCELDETAENMVFVWVFCCALRVRKNQVWWSRCIVCYKDSTMEASFWEVVELVVHKFSKQCIIKLIINDICIHDFSIIEHLLNFYL